MADVNCNGCTACCHGPIVLHPAMGDEPRNYRHHFVEGAGLVLDRNDDDSCIYLQAGGCSIWSKRPAICRAFDCRVYALSGWTAYDPLRDESVIAAGLRRQ